MNTREAAQWRDEKFGSRTSVKIDPMVAELIINPVEVGVEISLNNKSLIVCMEPNGLVGSVGMGSVTSNVTLAEERSV